MPASKSATYAKRGFASRGTIRELAQGRFCGFIETRDGRSVFFHGKDLEDGRFNDLKVGLAVRFELILDRISGDRAARIQIDRPPAAGTTTKN